MASLARVKLRYHVQIVGLPTIITSMTQVVIDSQALRSHSLPVLPRSVPNPHATHNEIPLTPTHEREAGTHATRSRWATLQLTQALSQSKSGSQALITRCTRSSTFSRIDRPEASLIPTAFPSALRIVSRDSRSWYVWLAVVQPGYGSHAPSCLALGEREFYVAQYVILDLEFDARERWGCLRRTVLV